MSNQGDDCYFFFYSTCSKGESCPFRHCKAALGNETVCTLWQEGRCFRQICKFRHMEIDKKRSMIPCFWENQLSGCQKGNCAFHHNKGRYIDGVYMPPSKKQIDEPEPSETDLQNFQTSSKFAVASTPHLREVIKTEAAENVPSPTHPPVVINAADDDEDDDDQISAEGDESKPPCQRGVHPGAQHGTTRKIEVLRKGPDFGIKTLEEIKSNWKNVIDLPKDEAPNTGRSLAQRLGKRKFFSQESSLASGGEGIPIVKKTLSERLGKRVVSPIADLDVQHKKSRVTRPLKDRLGLSPEQNSTETGRVTRPLKDRLGLLPEQNSTETGKADNTTTEFHIKTLQEIRQEKAGQRREEEPKCLPIKSKDHLCLKTRLSTKPQPIHVKSLHEIQAEKKQHQLLTGAQKAENKVDNTDSRERRDLQAPKKQDKNLRETEEKQRSEAGITCRVEVRKPLCVNLKETKKIDQSVEHVQIKTLEEIRKEKALKAQQNRRATDTKNLEPLSQLQVTSSEKRILRLSRTQVHKETDQGISDAKSQTNNTATALDTQTTVDIIPAVPAPATIFEKGVGEKTLEKQSADFTDTLEEPSKVIPEKIVKGKPKVNTEPNLMKKHSPAKTVIKRKAQQISPVAKVKPLNTTSTDEKKTILLPVSDSSVTQNVLVTSTSSKLKKENCEAPASDPVHSSTTKTRRTSVASSAKPSVPAEDDFDELIWDISDGKLGDEINLDPSKDEDDLLMELSEMIDS